MSETLSPVLPPAVDRAARRVLEAACAGKLSLATAESCTGGLLASLLTDVEGASSAFERGFVVYTNEAKSELLGIAPALIAAHGAVSRAVAEAMARGAIDRSRADIVLAVTGFAGPAGPGDEAGLVHFACLRRDRALEHREEHFGDIGRGPTRVKCIEVALEMLEKAL